MLDGAVDRVEAKRLDASAGDIAPRPDGHEDDVVLRDPTLKGLFPIEGVGPDFAVVGASVRG